MIKNHLKDETSPYLLQHAENPVDWYPWGPEALERARQSNRPIFLSIGYAACHWCHVMAHESFEDPDVAAILNRDYVSIKVDREERPDLDQIYMAAVVAMTGQGGWPMSVFLLPDGRPFYAGTYFPPTPRFNLPSFRQVISSLAQAWKKDRTQIEEVGQKLKSHLLEQAQISFSDQPLQTESLVKAVKNLDKAYDWDNGGWGAAPKFPQPMTIDFLLGQATRGENRALKMALHTLDAMSQGGMYDVVGGGFHRYSTDEHWLVPHFEKMLYDNAQLALVYLHAWRLTGKPAYRRTCEETLDFIRRELSDPQGGFYSSLDADSGGEEGGYYVWGLDEIQKAIGDTDDIRFLMAAYGLGSHGNFEGKNLLQRKMSDRDLAKNFGIEEQAVPAQLGRLHTLLLAARQGRVRPATDDKVLASWNALALLAFAEAARYLKRPDYLSIAIRNATFITTALHPSDRLLRSWRAGEARKNAYLEDYAGAILALLALYQSDPQLRWYRFADQLAEEMILNFTGPDGGFFDTRTDHEALLIRPHDLQDNATPSGNALAALALLRLAAYSDREDWRHLAEKSVGSLQETMILYPTAFACWLSALDFAIGPVKQVALLMPVEEQDQPVLSEVIWQAYQPRLVSASSTYPPEPGSPRLLEHRELINNLPTAFVCEGFVCRLPVTDAKELKAQLEPVTGITSGENPAEPN